MNDLFVYQTVAGFFLGALGSYQIYRYLVLRELKIRINMRNSYENEIDEMREAMTLLMIDAEDTCKTNVTRIK